MLRKIFGLMRNARNDIVLPSKEALLWAVGVFLDIVLGDVSGSMEDQGYETGKTKLMLMRAALHAFIDAKMQKGMNDPVCVIAYSDNATLCAPLLPVLDNADRLKQACTQMLALPHQGTYLVKGLQLAVEQLEQARPLWPGRFLPRLLVYSDGADASVQPSVLIADNLKRQGVMIECLGVAKKREDVDEVFLRQIATTDETGTHYRFLGDPETLQRTFSQIAHGTLTVE